MQSPGSWLRGNHRIREAVYSDRGILRAPWRLIGFGLLVAFGAQAVLGAAEAWFRAAPERALGQPLLTTWVALGATAAAVTIMLIGVEGRSWNAIAAGRGMWRTRLLFSGWGLGSMAIVATVSLLYVFNYLSFEITQLTVASGSPIREWVSVSVSLLLMLAPAALWEELVFRGYLWSVAADAGNDLLALVSTSLVFGLVHVTNPGAGVLSTVVVMLAGGCLGLVRLSLGLPAAWLAHLAWNWVMAAVLHVPVSGVSFEMPGYRAVVSGPAWITGGVWGPEGGAVAGVLLFAALSVAGRSVWQRPGGSADREVAVAPEYGGSQTERS